jgi:PTS system fructose-specific IIC component
MAKGIAILSSTLGEAHLHLAGEALKDAAARQGYDLEIRIGISNAAEMAQAEAQQQGLDLVLLSGESLPAAAQSSASKLICAPVSVVIRHPENFLGAPLLPQVAKPAAPAPAAAAPAASAVRLVAITSCPTGIAHTFMAAAALQKAGADLGYEIKVETQGSVGAKNTLTEEEIRNCSAAIIAADTHVDDSRFAGVRLYTTSTKEAIHHGKELIAKALALPQPAPNQTAAASKVEKRPRTGAYKHLMTGVSHMLPLVTAGGLLIALSFAIGGIHAGDKTGSLGWALMQIGGATAFHLYVSVLAAYIAFSIADRPGLCPGLVGGMLSTTLGAGFLGGILAGFLAGYVTKFLNDKLPIPKALSGLKPVLVLPVLSTLVVGLTMIYVIGTPVKIALGGLTAWLSGMQQSSALILGLLLGAMMAFDMGGPVNKAAYTFSVGMLASNVHGPIAAVMAAGMTPPLGIALATMLFKSRFTSLERNEGKVTAVLGLSFITEGAIPYAAADPFRVIPCMVLGSAVAGAISMASGCQLMVPHGGVFVLFIPNAVAGLARYALAIVCGSAVSALALGVVKRKVVHVRKVPAPAAI